LVGQCSYQIFQHQQEYAKKEGEGKDFNTTGNNIGKFITYDIYKAGSSHPKFRGCFGYSKRQNT
jgi:hypothetical protein